MPDQPTPNPLEQNALRQRDFAAKHRAPDAWNPGGGITVLPETVVEAERDSEGNVTRLVLAPPTGPRRGDAA